MSVFRLLYHGREVEARQWKGDWDDVMAMADFLGDTFDYGELLPAFRCNLDGGEAEVCLNNRWIDIEPGDWIAHHGDGDFFIAESWNLVEVGS